MILQSCVFDIGISRLLGSLEERYWKKYGMSLSYCFDKIVRANLQSLVIFCWHVHVPCAIRKWAHVYLKCTYALPYHAHPIAIVSSDLGESHPRKHPINFHIPHLGFINQCKRDQRLVNISIHHFSRLVQSPGNVRLRKKGIQRYWVFNTGS